MKFTFNLDSKDNVTISANGKTITGFNSFNIKYSVKGRGTGTKIILSYKAPIIKGGVTDFKISTFELPDQLDKVLALSEFWSLHAEEVPEENSSKLSKPKPRRKKAKTTVSEEDFDELEDAPFELEEASAS